MPNGSFPTITRERCNSKMDSDKRERLWTNVLLVMVVLAIAEVVALGWLIFCHDHKATAAVIDEEFKPYTFDIYDYEPPVYEWQEAGYYNVMDYHNDLLAKRNEANGSTASALKEYNEVLTEEQVAQLQEYEAEMVGAVTLGIYNENLESFNEIISKCEEDLAAIEAAKQQAVVQSYNSSSGGGYYSNGDGLTKSGGVYYFNGRKETWYSQRVLPGGGLNIPGRHVASDGTIRDADGYICVAASDLPYGSVVETSLGSGRVYDTGCDAGTTDIYVDW